MFGYNLRLSLFVITDLLLLLILLLLLLLLLIIIMIIKIINYMYMGGACGVYGRGERGAQGSGWET
jgi:hypothetical protein